MPPLQNKSEQVTLESVRKLFYKLYCFNSVEIEKFIKAAELMPQEGLNNLYKMLQDGKAQQDALLGKRIESDEHFLDDFSRYVENATRKIKQSYEEAEAEKAEEILKNV